MIIALASAIAMSGCGSIASHNSRSTRVARVSEGPKLPVTNAGHAGGIVRGLPVVAGGSNWSPDKSTKRWLRECFVCRNGQWIAGPDLPGPRSDPAYASDESGLYVAGGTDGKQATDHVLRLSSTSAGSRWETMTSLPESVEGATGVIFDRKFYVFGGFSADRASNRLSVLDLNAGDARWKNLAPLPADGRGYSALVALNSQLYLFGGFTAPPYTKLVRIFGDTYRYDPSHDRWTRLAIPELAGYGWTATALNRSQVMLVGRVAEIGKVSDDIWLFDINTGRSFTVGKLILPACCSPLLQTGRATWWYPGGEPDTNRSRSDRTSVIKLETMSHP